MNFNYVSVIFELVNGNEKILSYGLFEPYQYYSFSYCKENIIKKENYYKYNFQLSQNDKEQILIEYIKLLSLTSNKSFDSINLISILDKPIDQQYLIHFSFVLDQKSNPELKLISDEPSYILFDDSDYGLDEDECVCDLTKYKYDDDYVFVSECYCPLYSLPKDHAAAKEKLSETLKEISDEVEKGGPEFEDYWTEEDIINYKNSLPNAINWLTLRIKELESEPKSYTESFVKSILQNCEEKINFYYYLKRKNLVTSDDIKIKICNQILRKQKIRFPNKLRYNFVINNFKFKKDRDTRKHLEINFSNINKNIQGVYNLELRGVYGCYDYSRKETINFETEYDQENVIDQEYLKEVFQDEIFYEIVGHSSGVDPDEPGYYDE